MTVKRLVYAAGILLVIAAAVLLAALSELSESGQDIGDICYRRDLPPSLAGELQESSRSLSSAIHMVQLAFAVHTGLLAAFLLLAGLADKGGHFAASTALFHGVRAKKNAAGKAKHMAAIVSAADAGIVIMDPDGHVLEWNIGAENILGYKALEMTGKNPEYYNAGIDAIMEQTVRGGHTVHAEIVCRHKDGHPVDCSATFTPVFDGKKRCAGIVTVFQDISEKKEMERALQEAVRAAKEASRAKSSFLANMSHEIRTPMNGVVGFAELALDDGDFSDNVRDYLHKIKASAANLLGIINNILDISKIEAGAVELERIPFSLHDIFNECEYITTPMAEEKNISLYFYAEPYTGGSLLGDPAKLRQVLLNLLSNAIKFTHLGMVKLSSSLEEIGEGFVQIAFEVKDSGIGMSGEQLQKIFEPFAQGDSSTTRKYGGTGLGLSITKSFVEIMGGALRVESNPGLGSRFAFSLRFDTLAEETLALLPGGGQPVMEDKPVFVGDVLVCEDNSINQEVIVRHLSRVGLSAVLAANGKLGLDEVKKRRDAGKPFDLILMDIHMPVMDGLEATGHLLAMGCETPIIALTANAMATDRETYLAQGMRDYLSKPFTAEEMWICLARNLKPVSGTSLPSSGAKEERAEESPPSLCVLDEAEGITLSAGDKDLYQKIRGSFYRDAQDVMERIQSALADKDYPLARRTVHSLKTTAATLGAQKVSAAALGLENVLSEGLYEGLAKPLAVLSEALRELFTLLEAPVPKKTEGALRLDVSRACLLAEALEPLLVLGDPESLAYVEEIRHVLAPLGEEGEVLARRMEDFDFDLALETLRVVRAALSFGGGQIPR